ncbi:Spy/CpxP family protein refolding chaperone [Thalassotalea eurytherma]|uniref:Periplasmic heavy metal sensor n=1 Tax=Thalassotalea eurytherma TaxID=1144278 RepID=A0ABQ6H3U3_9GAMM|nr:Spy/CpxP family protein refolding chaperone [Thalassotalea eurytherma]GLX81467.1 hypothetical protein theurythT_09190 [Thalassotalea eurytherma]
MKKLTGAIVALTFTVAAATHAYATGFGDRIASKLDLTPEQTVQFQEVQSKRKAHMEDALKIREQIKALASSGDVDGAAILAGQQAEKKVRAMYALKTELSTFLTEDQMATLADIRERMAEKKQRMKQFISEKHSGE